jgi:hypothetical protein
MTVGFLSAELGRWDQLLREEGSRPRVFGLPFFEDERPLRGAAGLCDWRLGGRLSRLLGAGSPSARLRGAYGDRLLMPTGPRLPWERLVLFGLGPQADFDEGRASAAGRELLGTLRAAAPVGTVDDPVTLAIVPPGRSTGALSARRALELLLPAAAAMLDSDAHRLAVVESLAGQKESAELARQFASSPTVASPPSP